MTTTTLEQSQKLKELGAPQETVFYHVPYMTVAGENEVLAYTVSTVRKWSLPSPFYDDVTDYAAYTLSELIEWLGSRTKFTRKGKHITACLVVTGVSGQKDWYQAFYYNWSRKVEESEIGSGKTPLEAVYNLATAIKSNHTGGQS